jgi:GNAT superfamily N-acetyltransferase
VVTIRPATADDRPFLERVLVLAADWRPGTVPRRVDEMLAEPALAHYVDGWPRLGDAGVVAESEQGEPIGAAWWRYFTPDDRGYGLVAPDVPEVSVGVVPEARGAGIGTALLGALIDAAREQGVDRLSLSVEVDNPARALYARLGYVDVVVDPAGGAATMLFDVR